MNLKPRSLHLGLSLVHDHANILAIECEGARPAGSTVSGSSVGLLRSAITERGKNSSASAVIEFLSGILASPLVEMEIELTYREARNPQVAGFGPPLTAGRGIKMTSPIDILRASWRQTSVRQYRAPSKIVSANENAKIVADSLIQALSSFLAKANATLSPRKPNGISVVLPDSVDHQVARCLADRLSAQCGGIPVTILLPRESARCVAALLSQSKGDEEDAFALDLRRVLEDHIDAPEARSLLSLGAALFGSGASVEEHPSRPSYRFGAIFDDSEILVPPGGGNVRTGSWWLCPVPTEGSTAPRDVRLVLLNNDANGHQIVEIDQQQLDNDLRNSTAILARVDPQTKSLVWGPWIPGEDRPRLRTLKWRAETALGV
jgi:hypothetical protein